MAKEIMQSNSATKYNTNPTMYAGRFRIISISAWKKQQLTFICGAKRMYSKEKNEKNELKVRAAVP